MHSLRDYIKSLPPDAKRDYAARAGTKLGYLRKCISARLYVGPKLALRLEAASGGAVSRHVLRPDIFGPAPEAVPDARRAGKPPKSARAQAVVELGLAKRVKTFGPEGAGTGVTKHLPHNTKEPAGSGPNRRAKGGAA